MEPNSIGKKNEENNTKALRKCEEMVPNSIGKKMKRITQKPYHYYYG